MPENMLKWTNRRKLAENNRAEASELIRAGTELAEAGSLNDAVHFFIKAESTDNLLAIRKKAVEEGDFFLYNIASRGVPVIEELSRLADRATETGKILYAEKARHTLEEFKKPPTSRNHS